jgi:hypothetical protein
MHLIEQLFRRRHCSAFSSSRYEAKTAAGIDGFIRKLTGPGTWSLSPVFERRTAALVRATS